MLHTTFCSQDNAVGQGVVSLACFLFAFKFLGWVLNTLWWLVRPSKVKSYGKWAVVTGATDGIGLAFAHEFARNNLNVVLISRTQSKLDACMQEIQEKYPNVEVKTIQADFDKDDAAMYSAIQQELDHIPVGILVNNVGRSYPHAEFLNFLEEELVDSMIRMNILSTTRMTRMVLPGMVDRKKGCIVNISSAAGAIHTGNPMYTIYSATKAYVDFFSRSLDIEYKSKGIDVQCQIPYFVTSKLSKIKKSSATVPDPKTFARAAVSQIGYEASTVPFWSHSLQHRLLQSMPTFALSRYLMMLHQSIRKRALKKLEEKKK